MTINDNKKNILTIKQFVEKHPFISEQGLRWKIAKEEDFKKFCVRKFGRKVLIIEENVIEYIINQKK